MSDKEWEKRREWERQRERERLRAAGGKAKGSRVWVKHLWMIFEGLSTLLVCIFIYIYLIFWNADYDGKLLFL